ncbi:hypothetical protein [Rhodocaloribacter sp.]
MRSPVLCRLAALLCLTVPLAAPARAQLVADTLFAWKGYDGTGKCRVRIYKTPPSDETRTHVVVIRELAENKGPSTVNDARHLAEMIGRTYGIDPTMAYWIFHWGAFSYEGARPNKRKELFLRATFRRTKTQRLGAPTWRVITREDVEDYTDRQFQ